MAEIPPWHDIVFEGPPMAYKPKALERETVTLFYGLTELAGWVELVRFEDPKEAEELLKEARPGALGAIQRGDNYVFDARRFIGFKIEDKQLVTVQF